MENKQKIQVVNKSKWPLPSYETPQSAGADLRANIEESITLAPGERVLIKTGIFIALPVGWEAQIRSRSGLALKYGVIVLNAPGTIDADYRGDCGIILINFGHEPYTFEAGERIGQFVIKRDVVQADWDLVLFLDETERGQGGFGHSGKK